VIATTADGGLHWTDVTPKQLGSYWKVFTIEPGRFDPLTAYAAVNTLRIDDQNPHLFRTHDAGRTWTEKYDDRKRHWCFQALTNPTPPAVSDTFTAPFRYTGTLTRVVVDLKE